MLFLEIINRSLLLQRKLNEERDTLLKQYNEMQQQLLANYGTNCVKLTERTSKSARFNNN